MDNLSTPVENLIHFPHSTGGKDHFAGPQVQRKWGKAENVGFIQLESVLGTLNLEGRTQTTGDINLGGTLRLRVVCETL